jgi:hypothetical protein
MVDSVGWAWISTQLRRVMLSGWRGGQYRKTGDGIPASETTIPRYAHQFNY